MIKNPILEIQFIRAIACLLVVLVHVTGGVYDPETGFPDYFILTLNQFSRLGTPVFAVISAFLLFNSVKNRGFNIKKFFLSRTTKIVVPFIIWTIIYSTFSMIHYNVGFTDNFIFYFFTNFILGTGFYHLYFIVTIIQFYIIFPLVQLARTGTALFLLFLVSLPVNLIFVGIDHDFLNQINILNYIITGRSFILKWISFFMFGALLSYYYKDVRAFCEKNIIFLSFLFSLVFVGLYFEIDLYRVLDSSRPQNLIYIPIFILFLLSIYPFVDKHILFFNIFDLIGKYSMGIYLVHPLVLAYLDIFLPNDFWFSEFILLPYILTIIISVLLVKLILFLPFSKYIISVPFSKSKEISNLPNVRYKNQY